MAGARIGMRPALARIARVVHGIAYRIWVGLLAARLALLVALLFLLVFDMFISRAHAQTPGSAPSGGTSVAQMQLDAMLRDATSADVARLRSGCAMGQISTSLANDRRAGIDGEAPASAFCITVLTRVGRDGNLNFVRAPGEQVPRPSIVFDTGFVTGYLNHETVSSDAPTMAALLPLADRCLDESAPNPGLCKAVGQVLGARAAQGETVTLH